MQIDLTEKTVLITGGSRGIGKAIAFRFAESGAKVCFTNRNKEQMEQAAGELRSKFNCECFPIQGDISQPESCAKIVAEAIDQTGKIDFLVNNAGITRDNLFMRMKSEDWTSVIDTNLSGYFYMTQAVIKGMVKNRSGRIVNIGSVVGHTGNPGQVNYSASKSALIGLTKSVAKELASRNVLCNLISPGFIRTDMTDQLNEKQVEAILGQIPLKRYGEAEDIANAALFLCSPLSDYITGTTIHVNGGMY